MASNTTSVGAFKSSPLKSTDFKNWQQVFDAFAQGLIGSFEFAEIVQSVTNSVKGSLVTRVDKAIVVPNGATNVALGFDPAGYSFVLTNAKTAPTIGILGIFGTTLYLSAAAGNANYVINATTFTILG